MQTEEKEATETNEENRDQNHQDPEEHPGRAPFVHALEEDGLMMMVGVSTGNFTLFN